MHTHERWLTGTHIGNVHGDVEANLNQSLPSGEGGTQTPTNAVISLRDRDEGGRSGVWLHLSPNGVKA